MQCNVCVYVCIYVCMYACMHACMHACIYVCMIMYVCFTYMGRMWLGGLVYVYLHNMCFAVTRLHCTTPSNSPRIVSIQCRTHYLSLRIDTGGPKNDEDLIQLRSSQRLWVQNSARTPLDNRLAGRMQTTSADHAEQPWQNGQKSKNAEMPKNAYANFDFQSQWISKRILAQRCKQTKCSHGEAWPPSEFAARVKM